MNCKTTFTIPADHPAFEGHFPGMPILPGVLLLDAVVHALTEAAGNSASGPQAIFQINTAKFLSPVGPGETLTLVCTETTAGSTRFEILGDGRTVATGLVPGPASS